MVRPCVARELCRFGGSGLASMYPTFDWSVAPGHHGYQRACDLISGKASRRPNGSPVLARAGKTEPPSRLVLSQTSAGNSQSSRRLSGWRHGRPRLEASATSQNAPSNPGQFVGKRDGKNIAVQALLGGLDPGLEPVTLPALWLDQHDPRCLHE